MATVYVGNLPFTATDQDVRNLFCGCHAQDVRVLVDEDNQRPRGSAFIVVPDEQVESLLVRFNGRVYRGLRLIVDIDTN